VVHTDFSAESFTSTVYGDKFQRRRVRALFIVLLAVTAIWSWLYSNYAPIGLTPDSISTSPRFNYKMSFSFTGDSSTQDTSIEGVNEGVNESIFEEHSVKDHENFDDSNTISNRTDIDVDRYPTTSTRNDVRVDNNDLLLNFNASELIENYRPSLERVYQLPESINTDTRIFDPRVNQALIREKRSRVLRSLGRVTSKNEQWLNNAGENTVRKGNTCMKNDSALARVMGVDTMYFNSKCSTTHYDIELEFRDLTVKY
jgi:hypothetical protein